MENEAIIENKDEIQVSGIVIYGVVHKVPGLGQREVFVAVQKLMRSSNSQEFNLLKALPDEEKKGWILFDLEQE